MQVNLKIYIPVIIVILLGLFYFERRDTLSVSFNTSEYKDVTILNPGKAQFHFKTNRSSFRLKGLDFGKYVIRVTFSDGAKCTEQYQHDSSWSMGSVSFENPECKKLIFSAPGTEKKKKKKKRRGKSSGF